MNHKNKLITVLLLASSFGATAADSKLTASVRIGATVVDDEGADADFSLRNFGTRIKWSGEKAYDNGLSGIGYVELGLNPDNNSRGSSGADRTRQLWGGLKGDFGSVKIGAQYAAFYDLVSGHTDIAWWGSCWTQFECGRETRVLKYGGSSNGFNYSASIQGNPSDAENDPADELEFGFNYDTGPVVLGLATSIKTKEADNSSGNLIGAVAKGAAGPVNLALTLQFADDNFANIDGNTDDVTNATLAASYENFYTVLNATGNDDTDNPFFGTVGYTWNLGADSLMYFEAQFIDNGFDPAGETDLGETTILRATYKYDFGVL